MRAAVLVLLIFNLALAVMLKLESNTAPDQSAVAGLNSQKIQIVSSAGIAALRARCMELGPFNDEEALSVRRMLDERSLRSSVSSMEMPLPGQWWVYIAPLNSSAAAAQRARGLQRLGIKGYPVFDESTPWKHAISFGVFKSEEAALRLLEELKRKGVEGAKAETRNVTRTMFYMNEAGAEHIAQLTEIKGQFANAGLKQVNCPSSKNLGLEAGS